MNVWDERIMQETPYRERCRRGLEDAEAFVEGARWQREALLSDEVAERVADILVALDGDDYLIVARAALAVALGEDEK